MGIGGWSRISPVYLSVFLMRFSFGVVVFSLPRAYQNLTFLQIGVIAAAYPTAEILTVVFFGILADRKGRKPILCGGLFVSTVVIFLFTLTNQFHLLTMIHALQGIAAAMVIASSLALVADLATENTRGREMGFYDFANIAGYTVGPLLAGVLETVYSAKTPFYASSLIALIGGLATFAIVLESVHVKHRSHDAAATLKSLFRSRKSAAMFPIWLAVTTFLGMGLTFGPKLIPSALTAGTAFALVGLVLAVSQPFFGYLSDKYGRTRMMMLGTFSLLGLFTTFLLMDQLKLSLWVAGPFLALFGLGIFSFAPAALATLADIAPEAGRGTTMGAYSLVISFGTLAGPIIGGWTLQHSNFATLLYVSIVILLLAVALTVSISRGSVGFAKPSKTFQV